jgi:DnaJ family protein C protein 8
MAEEGWAKEKPASSGKTEEAPKVEKIEDDEAAFDALEAEQKEFIKVSQLIRSTSAVIFINYSAQDAEIDRILRAFRLDAYAVLDLQPGVPDSDIKKVYRTKSLLIHPDLIA